MLTDSLLLQKSVSLMYSLLEQIKVCNISLNLSYWQINQHTCDLWCKLLSNKFCNKIEDAWAHNLLVWRIYLSNSCENRHRTSVELCRHWVVWSYEIDLRLKLSLSRHWLGVWHRQTRCRHLARHGLLRLLLVVNLVITLMTSTLTWLTLANKSGLEMWLTSLAKLLLRSNHSSLWGLVLWSLTRFIFLNAVHHKSEEVWDLVKWMKLHMR